MRPRTNLAIRTCHRCGQLRTYHRGGGGAPCDLPSEVFEALRAFKVAHGRTWRSRLRALWDAGDDTGALRMARNLIGPSRLVGVLRA